MGHSRKESCFLLSQNATLPKETPKKVAVLGSIIKNLTLKSKGTLQHLTNVRRKLPTTPAGLGRLRVWTETQKSWPLNFLVRPVSHTNPGRKDQVYISEDERVKCLFINRNTTYYGT